MIYTLSLDIHVNRCKISSGTSHNHGTEGWAVTFDLCFVEFWLRAPWTCKETPSTRTFRTQKRWINLIEQIWMESTYISTFCFIEEFSKFFSMLFVVEVFGFAPACEDIVRTTTDWWIIGCHWLENRFCNQEVFLEEAAKDSAKACAIFIGTWCCN